MKNCKFLFHFLKLSLNQHFQSTAYSEILSHILKKWIHFKWPYLGTDYSQPTRLWFAGGFLLAWKVRLEARAKVREIPKWLPSFLSPLCIDCEQREQGGGEQWQLCVRQGGSGEGEMAE